MPLPDLHNGAATRDHLHQALQILREARRLGVPEMPNWLHLSLVPIQSGASTGKLELGGTMQLDYARGAIVWREADAERFAIALDGHTQSGLFEAVFDRLCASRPDLDPDRSKITGDERLAIDGDHAEALATAQWRMVLALARTKARLLGYQTPVALWPHGFDLSTLWFPGGTDEENDPHLNLGFSPGTPEVGEPYVYAYAWPEPPGLASELPGAFRWMADWSAPGGVLRWSTFAHLAEPEAFVERQLLRFHELAQDRLGGRKSPG